MKHYETPHHRSPTFLAGWVLLCCLFASQLPARTEEGTRGMVVSADAQASMIGMEILRSGGNAVDAAVAVGFALAVMYPEAGNIGGGGFMLIRTAHGRAAVVDFRETAPAAASPDMYGDTASIRLQKSLHGSLSVAIPGSVDGLLLALKKYGSMKRSQVIGPAAAIAARGIVVDSRLVSSMQEVWPQLSRFPSTMKIFAPHGIPLKVGDTLRQPDLARTLRRIIRFGRSEFYGGLTARRIVRSMRNHGGIITMDDLRGYRAHLRQPLSGSYRGDSILTVPPPSSGGACLLQLLNIVEGYPLRSLGYQTSGTILRVSEAMKRVFADRSVHYGDPATENIPLDFLLSKSYAEQRRNEIDTSRATPSAMIRAGARSIREGNETTHYVVADSMGNVVSATVTLNDYFGSKLIVAGAGFFLNDDMDDFSAQPGTPNLYGLIGGSANAIAPGKRPVSSMTPVIVLRDGKPLMALGSRGGPRIITSVAQTLMNVLDFGLPLRDAVDNPRVHHQWQPDTLLVEDSALTEDVRRSLEQKGCAVSLTPTFLGRVQLIYFDTKRRVFIGIPDRREQGTAAGF